MKKELAISVLLMCSFPTHADDIKIAINAAKADAKKSGNVFVTTERECKDHEGEYLFKSETMSVDNITKAVLLSSIVCGGNGVGKTLVIITNNKARIMKGFRMRDMDFLGDMGYVEGRTIVFHGDKWRDDDAHCCPSQKAELRFNIDTKQQSLTLVK